MMTLKESTKTHGVMVALALALGAALVRIGRARRKGLVLQQRRHREEQQMPKARRKGRCVSDSLSRPATCGSVQSRKRAPCSKSASPVCVERNALSKEGVAASIPGKVDILRDSRQSTLNSSIGSFIDGEVRSERSSLSEDTRHTGSPKPRMDGNWGMSQSPISYVKLCYQESSSDLQSVSANGGDCAGGTPRTGAQESSVYSPSESPRFNANSVSAPVRNIPSFRHISRQRSELGSLIKRGKSIPKMGTPAGGHFLMQRKLILVMVGLPARGKSYIVKMLMRYLRWIGFPCEVFNIGNVRRNLGYASVDASFFKGNNREMRALREKMANMVQDEMYEWLAQDETAKVALFDATNTTKDRRKALLKRNAEETNVSILFIESICNDPVILERNYSLKLQNDDYKNMDPELARKDFETRVKAYEKVYESIDDNEHDNRIKYIKLFNVGQKVITRHVVGYLPSQVSFFLQNIHISPRKIYLTLHAESIDTSFDSDELTEEGREYAILLAKFIRAEQVSLEEPGNEIMVLTGTQEIHTETIGHLTMLYPCAATNLLNSTFSQEDSQTTDQATKDLIKYAGITGESHFDVIHRVRPLILELERQTRSLVVVSHPEVIRCLYAYFVGVPVEELKTIKLNMHTLIELVPGPFGTEVHHRTMEEMQLICS